MHIFFQFHRNWFIRELGVFREYAFRRVRTRLVNAPEVHGRMSRLTTLRIIRNEHWNTETPRKCQLQDYCKWLFDIYIMLKTCMESFARGSAFSCPFVSVWEASKQQSISYHTRPNVVKSTHRALLLVLKQPVNQGPGPVGMEDIKKVSRCIFSLKCSETQF